MITDFPEAKGKIKKTLDAILRQQVKQNSPMLQMVSKKMLHEGNKLGVLHSDGRHVVDELQYVESKFFIARKDVPTLKPGDFVTKVVDAAKDMAGQMEKKFFKTIDDSIKESGNAIPGNPELGPESILSALEMVAIDFEDDDRSKPIKPSLFAGPDAVKKLMEKEAAATPEEKADYYKREEVILDRKYQEYLKDLELRKIID